MFAATRRPTLLRKRTRHTHVFHTEYKHGPSDDGGSVCARTHRVVREGCRGVGYIGSIASPTFSHVHSHLLTHAFTPAPCGHIQILSRATRVASSLTVHATVARPMTLFLWAGEKRQVYPSGLDATLSALFAFVRLGIGGLLIAHLIHIHLCIYTQGENGWFRVERGTDTFNMEEWCYWATPRT